MSKSQFYELSQDKKVLTTPNGEQWVLQRELAGRGQSGFGGFYESPNGSVYVVKADDPGTCLAEATATNVFIAKDYQKSAACARIGYMGDKLITIQPCVSSEKGKIKGLDQVVYGRKRRPKTLWSEESTSSKKIKTSLRAFSSEAKRDLASALFASTVLGDESLHLGQFMAVVSDTGRVTGVVRVDFGARERFTRERVSSGDLSPEKTSRAYSGSGQFGKDYISYLVKSDVQIRVLYLTLWAKADVKEISNTLVEKFRQELNALPEEKQMTALNEFLKQFNRKAKAPFQLDTTLSFENQKEQFLEMYQQSVASRCASMSTHAQSVLFKLIREQSLLGDAERATLNKFFSTQSISEDLIYEVHEIHKKLCDSEHAVVLVEAIQSRMDWYRIDNDMVASNTTASIMSTLESYGETPSEDNTSDFSEDESRTASMTSGDSLSESQKSTSSIEPFEIHEPDSEPDTPKNKGYRSGS